MKTLSYKTKSANKKTANKKWFLVDIDGEVLWRAAYKIAKVLRGKYKKNFTPHADCGYYVVIVNANKFRMTGNKMIKREIFSYTGFPGGQKKITPSEMLDKDGTSVVRHAIKGMLPKNKLGREILKNCYIFSSENHNKNAQKPELLNLKNLK